MLTGVDEPHHRCAKLTIAIATLQSAAAELVIIDWNWRSRAFVTSVASWRAPRPSYSSEPESTFHGNPLATPSDCRMMSPYPLSVSSTAATVALPKAKWYTVFGTRTLATMLTPQSLSFGLVANTLAARRVSDVSAFSAVRERPVRDAVYPR